MRQVLGTDGAIYAIPQKAARVLKISNFGGDSDPTVELIGPSLGDGKCKWCAAFRRARRPGIASARE